MEFHLGGSGNGSIRPKSVKPLKGRHCGSAGGSTRRGSLESLRPHRWSPAHLAQRVAPACARARERRGHTRRPTLVAARGGAANLRRSGARCAERRRVARAAARLRLDAVGRRERHRRARRLVDDHARVSRRGERRVGALPRRRLAQDELRSRVDPLRHQSRRAVPHRRPPAGHAHVDLADRRDERRAVPRPGRRRDLRARGTSRRPAHPSRRDSRPARPRRHAGRAALVARPAGVELDPRPAARRRASSGAVSDRPDRADRRVRPRRGSGRHDELHRRDVDRLVEPRHHEAVGRGRRRRDGRAADGALDRRDHGAERLESDRHDGAGRHRLRSSRRSTGTSSTARRRLRSRSRGPAATPTHPAASSRTRASTRSSASTRAQSRR